jgi:uncharacterized phage-associated protein
MTTKAKVVANYILELAKKSERTVTPMQLIKLVYLCHGWMLGIRGRPLIDDEQVQAWRYGPVISSVYQETKHYKSLSVSKPLKASESFDLTDDEKSLVDAVYKSYRDFSGIALSSMTHEAGTPWSIVWEQNGECNAVISNDIIEEHYSEKYRNQQAN